MIDRIAREKTVAAIEAYMNDEMKAFAFDDALYDIAAGTKDEAVREATQVLWYFYDDLIDHPIHANKFQWNFMYRIILFLRSNAELEKKWIRRWSLTQIMAFGLALLLAGIGWTLGASWPLLIVWIVAGVLTWEIDRRIRAPHRNRLVGCPIDIDVFPFDSSLDILRAARSVPDFHKRRFPPELADRRIRNRWLEAEIHLPRFILLPLGFVGWTIMLPFVLLGHLFPLYVCRRNVIISIS